MPAVIEIDDALKTALDADQDVIALVAAHENLQIVAGEENTPTKLPFVRILTVTESEPELTTEADGIDRLLLDIQVRSRSKSQAAEIRRTIRSVLDRIVSTIDLGADRLMSLLRVGGIKVRENDGVWNLGYQYEAQIHSQ